MTETAPWLVGDAVLGRGHRPGGTEDRDGLYIPCSYLLNPTGNMQI